jgi:intraflagellar transport protein 80
MSVPGISPYAAILQQFSKKKNWESAIKMCRHVKHKELWASLVAMSIQHQDLNTAEVAYAAIDEVSKYLIRFTRYNIFVM